MHSIQKRQSIVVSSFSLLAYHPAGQVLLTVGTGERVCDIGDLKLLPLHSYAITGMRNYICSASSIIFCADVKDDEDRTVSVVNPWRERQDGEPPIGSYASRCSGQSLNRTWRLELVVVYYLQVF